LIINFFCADTPSDEVSSPASPLSSALIWIKSPGCCQGNKIVIIHNYTFTITCMYNVFKSDNKSTKHYKIALCPCHVLCTYLQEALCIVCIHLQIGSKQVDWMLFCTKFTF
jgi:hypothetical protein